MPTPSPQPTIAPKTRVAATTTVLADLARNVGGDLVEVISIVPPGADIHSFQTTPSHSVAIGQARVIISNGFGLDSFLDPVLVSAMQPSAVRVVAAEGLTAEPLEERPLPGEGTPEDMEIHSAGEDGDNHGRGYLEGDPHFWQDPTLAIHYVEQIRDGLIQADPVNADIYTENAERYIQGLQELDQEIAQILSQVPPERRHLVSFHDAFGYFARRYGWQVSFFEASDASDVTPGAVEEVVRQVQSGGIPAVFAEPQFSPDVLEQVARDTGIRIGTIHSLVDNTAPTYIEMMRANANSLAENLR